MKMHCAFIATIAIHFELRGGLCAHHATNGGIIRVQALTVMTTQH